MRSVLLVLFVVILCGKTAAQKIITTENLVIYPPLKEFFERNRQVEAVDFADSWQECQGLMVRLITVDTPLLESLNEFHLNDAGDHYFFEKEYGRFDLPDSLYKQFTRTMKEWAAVSGTIRRDSVFFTFTQTIYKSDEKVFIKLEKRKDYKGGLHLFAKVLEDMLAAIPVAAGDSILLFQTFLDKSRKMTVLNVELGNSASTYTNAVCNCIESTNLWIPYEKDGHYMRSYQKLYIRRYADGSYRVAMD